MAGTVITNKGVALIAKLLAANETLVFSRAAVGTGRVPTGYNPQSMTSLNAYKMDGIISNCSSEGDTASVVFQISSLGVHEGFTVTEAGLFANDPDDGEILYAYLDMSNDPQYIYAEGGAVSKFAEIELKTVVGQVEKVSAIVNPQSLITKEKFEEHTKNEDNPHKVTKQQIGLGQVPDVSTNDQTPTYDQATTRDNITSGEKLSTAMGKIKKWFADTKTIAFTGSASDLTQDATHRLVTDTEKTAWNGKVAASGGDVSNTVIKTMDTISADFPVPAAGESTKTFTGKVKKFITDFNSFKTGIITVGKLVNNFQTTNTGFALDARAGKTLNDAITQLNSDLTTKILKNVDIYNQPAGKYYCFPTVSNLPTAGYYYVDIITINNAERIMYATNSTFCKTYINYFDSSAGTWRDWISSLTNSDLNVLHEVLTGTVTTNNANIDSIHLYHSGRVTAFEISVTTTKEIEIGGNIIIELNKSLNAARGFNFVGYLDRTAIIGYAQKGNTLTCRIISNNLAAGAAFGASGCFIS